MNAIRTILIIAYLGCVIVMAIPQEPAQDEFALSGDTEMQDDDYYDKHYSKNTFEMDNDDATNQAFAEEERLQDSFMDTFKDAPDMIKKSASGDEERETEEEFNIERQTSDSVCCPNKWHGYNGMCYRMFTTTRSWESAQSHCALRSGGALARADSSALNTFLATYVAGQIGVVWIGLNDRDSLEPRPDGEAREGDFHWVDNDDHLHGFDSWARRQPDDGGRRREQDCVLINYNFLGGWDDDNCDEEFGYICQMPALD
ncbi:C-type lectin galactose-binding isoform-like [Amphiura filiformis]|uniref:C-type lectin galactose-binding isoform-like n=1 Tax=Amphiura filiformis TaxID=82378 RepID=UPI003B21A15C